MAVTKSLKMMVYQPKTIATTIVAIYFAAYAVARLKVFHAVEHYADLKSGGRYDYIAKKDHAPGEGWEYYLFLPAIKLEESCYRILYN